MCSSGRCAVERVLPYSLMHILEVLCSLDDRSFLIHDQLLFMLTYLQEKDLLFVFREVEFKLVPILAGIYSAIFNPEEVVHMPSVNDC